MIAPLHTARQALHALRANRLRTALSVIGVAFGVAAVVAVSALSAAGERMVRAELETFGLRSVWVYRDWGHEDSRHRDGSGIEQRDLAALRDVAPPAVELLSPIVRLRERRDELHRGARRAQAQIDGVGLDYAEIANDRVVAGRWFNRHDLEHAAPVAVIGPALVERLFADRSPLGEELRLDGRRLRVIGVLAAKSRDFLASIGSVGGLDANDRALLPRSWVQGVNGNRAVNLIQLRARSMAQAAAAGEFVAQLLQRRRSGRYHFSAETMAGYIGTADRILGGVGVVGVLSAGISLLVGGIGIASIMSTAVAERTGEIGLRRAVGARSVDIQRQFLLEAALISAIGGLLGLAVGAAIGTLLAQLTGWDLLPAPSAVAGALSIAVATGLAAGYLPARRAAGLHPVAALRRHG